MPLRNRILILIGAGVSVVVLISLVLIWSSKNKNKTVVPPEQTQTTETFTGDGGTVVAPTVRSTTVPVGAVVKPATKEEVTETTLRQMAKIFVERFHTYSSENNYQNVRDVESLVTLTFWNKISAPMYAKTPAPANFVSVTTEVVGVVSSEMQSNAAIVDIKARKTSLNNGVPSASYVDYSISFTKVGSKWLISGEQYK
jgi:hypothetical protein